VFARVQIKNGNVLLFLFLKINQESALKMLQTLWHLTVNSDSNSLLIVTLNSADLLVETLVLCFHKGKN